MATKWDKKIRKIEDNVYQVDKEGSMNVPLKIFASEKLLEKMKQDDSIQQGINVACMPGIQKQSIMLSDAHLGYGFPVGGVGAFDVKDGCISPGGIGFDINCLHPDTKINLNNGTWMTIEELEKNWKNVNIDFLDYTSKYKKNEKILLHMKRLEDKKLYVIKTKCGRKIKVTGDHPIFTKEGMVNSDKLMKNEEVLLHGFSGIKYEKPSSELILSETDIEKTLDQLNISNSGNARIQILKYLRSKNFMDLHYNSPQIPILLKLMGFIFGDGVISFINKKKGRVSFYANEEDLIDIKDDLESICIKISKINKRIRNHEFKANYGTSKFTILECSISKNSAGFASLLVALGVPYGRKTEMGYRVPEWIMKAPKWQKRLFLASFFGAELSKSSTLKKNKYTFYDLQLNMNKSKKLKQNGIDFLNDLRLLLSELGVESRYPVSVAGNDFKGKISDSIGLRFLIPGNSSNLITFFETVGYEYNKKGRFLASIASNYLRQKENIIGKRTKIRKIARDLYNSGIDANKIVERLENEYTEKNFILHSLYSQRQIPRIAYKFLSFQDYLQKNAYGIDGFMWDQIEKIEEIPYEGFVYDLTVNDESHNFIAENIVVSNCGVRLLTTDLDIKDVQPKISELINVLFDNVHCGVGSESNLRLSDSDLDEVLNTGLNWALKNNYATKEDLDHCEENGSMKTADASKVSQRAKSRGRKQLGTLGAGNHFLEIQYIEKIYDDKIAKVFGINKENQIVVMVHTGSRGLGHQTCGDYLRKIEDAFPDIVGKLPEKDLAYAPTDSKLAKDYLGAMSAAANYGWCNRQVITKYTRDSFKKVFCKKIDLKLVYDVAHNIAKVEEYVIDGKKKKVYVHRKGATRAFGPGHKEVPVAYRKVGQPIILPGSMGTASYVLVGTDKAMNETFSSTPHGAGRMMSRHEASRRFDYESILKSMEKDKIIVKSASNKGVVQEAPGAYKDVDEVVRVADAVGIGKKVARLRPLGCIKG